MTEIFSAFKSLFMAAILIMAMQIKIGGKTIESICFNWLHNSKIAAYLQDVADGGALALRNLAEQSGETFRHITHGTNSDSSSETSESNIRARR